MSDILRRQQIARQKAAVQQRSQQSVSEVSTEDTAARDEFEKNNVQLKTGEWISRADFEKLSNEDQTRISELGIKGFNDYYKVQEADFLKKNVQIGNEWISKDTFESLSAEDQKRMRDLGIAGFNEYYKKQKAEFEANNVKLSTGEWIAKTDYDGLSPMWQSQIKAMGTAGFQNWLKTAYPGAKGFIQIDDPSAGVMVYGKTDNPDIGIDAGGNRVWIGGRWPDATRKSMQGVDLKSLSSRWPSSVSGALKGVVITVKGEIYDKKLYNELPSDLKDILNTQGFAAYQKELETRTEKSVEAEMAAPLSVADIEKGVEVMKADAEGKVEAVKASEIKAEIAEIEEKQKQFGSQPLWAKVAQVLNTPVTFEEFVQETVTLGETKTAAFDSDQISKDYKEMQVKATDAGQVVAMSESEYKDQVLGKQATAADLGLQFAPFEYMRPERMKELQWWESIVYPMLDVATLVPIVGLGAKAVSAGLKGGSAAAKIASLGGKSAIEFAAKDATMAVEKATAKKLAQEGLLAAVKEGAISATDDATRKVLEKAIKPAMKDVQLANKEYSQIVKNANELSRLSNTAIQTETKGAKAFRAVSRAEEELGKAGRRAEPLGTYGTTGVIAYTTIANWNEMSPEQRVFALSLGALTSGAIGKAGNIAENIIDPYKIPISALKGRAVRSKAVAGQLYAPEKIGKGIKGTKRLVLDHTIKPEDARETVASLMKQLTEGESVAKAKLKTAAGEREIKVKGTGLQKTVGKTSVSATPMGEIFKEGTGAGGAKTNLERYLRDANAIRGTKIEIEAKPLKVGDAEIEVKTISAPGVTVKGAEGGMYLGADFYNQFSHKAAFGAGGKISAGLLVSTPGISDLPKGIKNLADIEKMEKAAIKQFDGAKYINKEVEGFKKYNQFMEFENVITNGSQLQRSQNLRSNLADKLHMNRGEYYTRDPKGRIELFQMYLEGGRTTPYTLKELYKLKGNALQNSLEDLFYGIERRIDDLKQGKIVSPKENIITKEAQLSKAFGEIDEAVSRKGLTEAEAKRLKADIVEQYRSRIETVPNRAVLRDQIGRLATRTEAQRAKDAEQERDFVDRVRKEREDLYRRTVYGDTGRVAREGERGAARELPRERGITREAPREIPREREIAREAPREGVREPMRDREAPREAPRETPREVGRETPRDQVKGRTMPRETTRPVTEGKVKPIPKIVIKLPDGTEKALTRKQIEGAIAWRQGLFYQMRWPPFEAKDVIYSREPLPGVKYHDGIGSAAKSAVVLYGEIPKHVRIDMGIVDVNIFRGKDIKAPTMKFKSDVKGKTKYTGVVKEKVKKGR